VAAVGRRSVEGTIVGMIPSVRGCHPPPRPSLRTIPLLGEMVNLLGTHGASRGSSTTYVVLRRCTYLALAHALRARIFFSVPGYWYTTAYT
jgi:hypothetical protein